jgi:hypothetical protein
LATVCGADVINVARITPGTVLGIDIVHDSVERGGFAPALVSPVAAPVGEHAGEVAHGRNARPGKAGTAIGVSPTVAAVSRSEKEIGVVVGKATATFIHARDIHIACGKVAGNLDITDKRCATSDLPRVGPTDTVISGIANKEGSAAYIEVIP